MPFERMADEDFAYVTTTGRVTGKRHTWGWREGKRLSSWARNALPVAVEPK